MTGSGEVEKRGEAKKQRRRSEERGGCRRYERKKWRLRKSKEVKQEEKRKEVKREELGPRGGQEEVRVDAQRECEGGEEKKIDANSLHEETTCRTDT